MLHRIVRPSFFAALAASWVGGAQAAVFTLADAGQNSSMVYDTSQGSLVSWDVEGVDYLFNRSYYFRIGAGPESRVDDVNLTLANSNHYNGNFIAGNEGLALLYLDPAGAFSIRVNMVLTAGAVGSNQATFTESVRIDNLGQAPLSFTLIQYADYDLDVTAIDDSLVFGDPRSLTQTGGGVVHESSVTVTPAHIEASYFSSLIVSLNDGGPTTLNDNASLFNGDVVYGFQWNFLIPASGSVTLGNTNSIVVPEASALGLLGLAACGVSGLAFFRRRK